MGNILNQTTHLPLHTSGDRAVHVVTLTLAVLTSDDTPLHRTCVTARRNAGSSMARRRLFPEPSVDPLQHPISADGQTVAANEARERSVGSQSDVLLSVLPDGPSADPVMHAHRGQGLEVAVSGIQEASHGVYPRGELEAACMW